MSKAMPQIQQAPPSDIPLILLHDLGLQPYAGLDDLRQGIEKPGRLDVLQQVEQIRVTDYGVLDHLRHPRPQFALREC